MTLSSGKRRAVTAVIFAVYIVLMIYLMFFRNRTGDQYWLGAMNLVPFRTIWGFLSMIGRSDNTRVFRLVAVNLAGNIVVMIPFGYFLPAVFGKLRKYIRTLATASCIIIIAEIIQYVTARGSCDIDDLILNMIGISAGYLIFWATLKKKK